MGSNILVKSQVCESIFCFRPKHKKNSGTKFVKAKSTPSFLDIFKKHYFFSKPTILRGKFQQSCWTHHLGQFLELRLVWETPKQI